MAQTILVTPGQAVGPADWDTLLLQHGNLPPNAQPQPVPISDPLIKDQLVANPGLAVHLQQHPAYRYYMADGSSVVAFGMENGQDVQILEYKPSATFTAAQRREQQSPAESRQPPKEKDENGRRYVWNPDLSGGQWVDVGPAPATKAEEPKPPTERVNPGDPSRRQVWNPQAGNGQGAWEDSGAVVKPPEESKPPQERVNPADPTRRQVWNPQGNSGTGAWQDAGPVAQKPEEVKPPTERVNPADPTRRQVWNPRANNNQGAWEDSGVNAQPQQPLYSQVTQDKDTGKWWGLKRDGSGWVELPPGGPGSTPATGPVTRAPSLPQIVLGRSQEALRQAYDEIQAEVDAGRRTPAWGENRRREVMEAARMTVDEGRMGLQDDQYNRSLAFNIANTRLQYGQNAFENAMRFALSINDKIEPGSAAGANLFRASFMLQMQMMRDSGIMNVPGRGQTSPILRGVEGQGSTQAQRRPPLIADIDRPERMVERSNQIAENIKAGLEASGAPREYTPASATTPGREPLAAPAAPAAPPATPPAAATVRTSAPAPVSPPIPRDPVLTSPLQAPGAGPALRVRDPYGNEFEMTQQQIDRRPGGSSDLTILGPVSQTRSGRMPEVYDNVPRPTAEEMARSAAYQSPVQLDPARYGHTPDNPLPASPRFAALERFRMGDTPPVTGEVPAPAVVPPNPMDPQVTGMMPNALNLAQIRATPPWRLPMDQLDDLVNQYGEDAVFGYPSMGVPA